MYPFLFCKATHRMLLGTCADRIVISTRFARNRKLHLVNSDIKIIWFSDGHRVPMQYAAAPFQINTGTISSTVAGTLMEDLTHDVVTGLDWLR